MTSSIDRIGSSPIPLDPEPTSTTSTTAPSPPTGAPPLDLATDRAEVPPAVRPTTTREGAYFDGLADAYMDAGNEGIEAFFRANPQAAETLARGRSPDDLQERLASELHERMSFDPFGVRSGPASLAMYGELRETLRGTLMEEMRREASSTIESTLHRLSGAEPEAVRSAINSAGLGSPLFDAAERMGLIGLSPEAFSARWSEALGELREARGHLRGTTWEAGDMPTVRDRVLARHGLTDSGVTRDAIRPEHREHAELAHRIHQLAELATCVGSIEATGHLVEPIVEFAPSLVPPAAAELLWGHEHEPSPAERALFGRR